MLRTAHKDRTATRLENRDYQGMSCFSVKDHYNFFRDQNGQWKRRKVQGRKKKFRARTPATHERRHIELHLARECKKSISGFEVTFMLFSPSNRPFFSPSCTQKVIVFSSTIHRRVGTILQQLFF